MGNSYPSRATAGTLIADPCVLNNYDLVSKAVDFLIQNGVNVDVTSINLSGALTRADEIDRPGKKDCAYGVHLDAPATAWCMNWRTGEKASCVLQGKPSSLDRAVLRERAAIRDKALGEEMAIKHTVAAAKARAIYDSSKVGTKSHPYCVNKGLEFGPEVRRCRYLDQDCLVVPLFGMDGQLWSLLFIGPGKVFHEGKKDKTLLTGGRKKGCFFPLGPTFCGAKRVLVGEGIATIGAAVRATGLPGVMAMDKGNLLPVATIVKAQAALGAEIVILADDDFPETYGFQYAKKAAESVRGYVAEPSLGKNADFWDVWHELGDEAVLDRINRALGARVPSSTSHLVKSNNSIDIEDPVWQCEFNEPAYPDELYDCIGVEKYACPCDLEEPSYLHEVGIPLGVEEYVWPSGLKEPINLHRVWEPAGHRGVEDPAPVYEFKASSNSELRDLSRQGDGNDWQPEMKVWPTLDLASLPTIVREFIEIATESSEADPAAVVGTFLVRLGVEVGSPSKDTRPFVMVGESRHEPRINCVITGNSSKARKGTSSGPVARLFQIPEGLEIDLKMAQVSHGPMSTGEGMVYAVRDASYGWSEKDQEYILLDPGIPDKRLYVQEEEFVAALSSGKRDGNTLSATLRSLWDIGDRAPMTKTSRTCCTGAHVGVLAHITIEELRLTLSNIDMYNGYANRFLWMLARRPKRVPMPERMPDDRFVPIQNEMLRLVACSHGIGQLVYSGDAKEYWNSVYDRLTEERPGVVGAITARAEAQVVRLSMLFALCEASPIIGVAHLRSALAVWDYAQASAEYIFSEEVGKKSIDNKIKSFLERSPEGLSLTELHASMQNHVRSHEMKAALQRLSDAGLISSDQVRKAGAVRKTTLFRISTPANFAN